MHALARFRSLHPENRRRQDGGTLLGLALGLVFGVLVSFGVVWYLNKTPLPFVEKVAKPEGRDKAPGEPVALPGKPGDKPVGSEKKFEFYDILEGKKPPAPSGSTPPVSITPAKPAEATPPSPAPAPAPQASSSGVLYLQAGAFQKAGDADALKGRLAMLGFEAAISEAEVPDKGVMRRVRIGPFADAEQMNRARAQLSQNGIPATVVRIKQ